MAVDKHGRTVDFLLTHRRNAKAAQRFLAKALRTRQNWPPHLINTDKNPAYGEALRQLKRDDPTIKGFEVMRMIRKRQCILLEPGITGEVRFVNKLFGLAA